MNTSSFKVKASFFVSMFHHIPTGPIVLHLCLGVWSPWIHSRRSWPPRVSRDHGACIDGWRRLGGGVVLDRETLLCIEGRESRWRTTQVCPHLSTIVWWNMIFTNGAQTASASFVSWKAFGVMIYNQSTEQPHVLRDVPKLGTVDLNCGTGSHQVFSQVYSFAHRTAPEVKKAPQKMDSKKASCSMGLGP